MPTPTYGVYVIELGGMPKFNNRCRLYVGQSAKTPEDRFAQHLAGGRTASRRVARYGTRLRPRLYRRFPRYSSREEAEAAEIRLRANLAARGWKVYGGTGWRMFQEHVPPATNGQG